jgi:hypothetical protein
MVRDRRRSGGARPAAHGVETSRLQTAQSGEARSDGVVVVRFNIRVDGSRGAGEL